ncbi:MAG: ASCH domain-containing protein [Pseudomonadota bacterium]
MSISHLAEEATQMWRTFMARPETQVDARLFDVMTIGETAAMADRGAAMVLTGMKTASATLPAAFGAEGPPPIGSYAIVLDGSGRAVCVVRTESLALVPFREIGEDFVQATGEWDGTVATWRARMTSILAAKAEDHGLDWEETTEVLCERFRVVHRAGL